MKIVNIARLMVITMLVVYVQPVIFAEDLIVNQLEVATKTTAESVVSAMALIDAAHKLLLSDATTQADDKDNVKTIIDQIMVLVRAKQKLKKIREKLLEETEENGDKESYLSQVVSGIKSYGATLLAPLMSGYGYSEDAKENAPVIIGELQEQRIKIIKKYVALPSVKQAWLKGRYSAIVAQFDDVIYKQQLITGDVMSTQKKLLLGAGVAAGLAIAKGYLGTTPETETPGEPSAPISAPTTVQTQGLIPEPTPELTPVVQTQDLLNKSSALLTSTPLIQIEKTPEVTVPVSMSTPVQTEEAPKVTVPLQTQEVPMQTSVLMPEHEKEEVPASMPVQTKEALELTTPESTPVQPAGVSGGLFVSPIRPHQLKRLEEKIISDERVDKAEKAWANAPWFGSENAAAWAELVAARAAQKALLFDVEDLQAIEDAAKTAKETFKKEREKQERIKKENAEKERIEQERIETEKAEKERVEQERIEKVKFEQEKLEQEKIKRVEAEQKARAALKAKKEDETLKGLIEDQNVLGAEAALPQFIPKMDYEKLKKTAESLLKDLEEEYKKELNPSKKENLAVKIKDAKDTLDRFASAEQEKIEQERIEREKIEREIAEQERREKEARELAEEEAREEAKLDALVNGQDELLTKAINNAADEKKLAKERAAQEEEAKKQARIDEVEKQLQGFKDKMSYDKPGIGVINKLRGAQLSGAEKSDE